MKKIYILLFSLVLLAMQTFTFGQSGLYDYPEFNSKLEVGFLGGVSIATFNLDKNSPDSEIKMRTGFSGGVLLRYVFDENFSVQPAVLYSMMGSQLNSSTERHEYKYNYINIPVIVNVTFPMHDVIKPRLFMGPELGIVLDANEEITLPDKRVVKSDIKNKVKKPNFSMVFGAGIDYALGNNNITVDFRYNIGINDINDGFLTSKVYSRNFTIMTGYSIAI